MKRILLPIVFSLLAVVSVRAQVILQDDFGYANGILTNVSSGLWTNYSGTPDSAVVNNKLQVFGSRAGDVSRPFTNTPGSVLYASFIVNSTNLSAGSNYFAHFLITGSTTFKGKVYAFGNAAGTAPNAWRLGISAATSPGASGAQIQVFPLDLATNADYRVVMSYDTASFLGTLWVDPVVMTDANKQTIDSTTGSALNGFAFRQSGPNPNLLVDDLYVGNTFDDVNAGAVKPATVYYQPEDPVTIFTGNNKTLYCVGGGAGTVTFQWQKGGVDITDDATHTGTTSNALSIVSATTPDSGNYACVVTSTTNGVFAGSITSAVSHVTVSVALVPPTITTQPTNQTVFFGQPASLIVAATGPGTITYQWKANGVDLPGEISSTLFIPSVQPFNGTTNTYSCGVTNEYGGKLSSSAVLSGVFRPTVSVAFLRTLVDPATYLATNSTTLYSVVGTVTTFTNLTTANTSSYYLQDSTAGINIFATFGSTFRPALGDVVAFSGVLSSFNSTLELLASTAIPDTSYFVISNNLASLPAPKVIPFGITNDVAFCEANLEGRIVMLTNVFFGTNAGLAIPAANTTVVVTNEGGETFNVFFSSQDLDTTGQTLPDFAWSVTGPMTQATPNTDPIRNAGYNVTVTRYADIIAGEPPAVTTATTHAGGSTTLTWPAVAYNYSYSVLSSTNVAGPYGPESRFQATMLGVNEVPATVSTATGFGTVALSPDQSTITVNMSFSGLATNASAAHIHGPAGVGTNTSVLFGFTGVPAAKSGAIP
jgi:hypothetical protein